MTLLSQVLNILGQLALTPIFLIYWDRQLYGEWLALSAALYYLTALDLGVQTYLLNRLTQCFAEHNIKTYNAVLQSGLALILLFSTSFLIILGLAGPVLPIERWFGFQLTDHQTTTVVALLLGVQVAGTLVQGLYIGVYRTIGSYSRGIMIWNAQRLLFLLLTAAGVATGGGLVRVAVLQCIPPLLSILYAWNDLRTRNNEIRLGVQERDWALALSFLGPSLLFFMIQLSALLSLQGAILLTSVTLGAGAVAILVTYRTLGNLARQLLNSFSQALWPELTILVATGQYELLQTIHRLTNKLTLFMTMAVVLCIQAFGPLLLSIWTHGRIPFERPLMGALMGLVLLQSLYQTSALILVACNNQKPLAICQTLSAITGLLLGNVLISHIGLLGVLMGLLVADSLICLGAIPYIACRMLKEPYSKFLERSFLGGLPALFPLALLYIWVLIVQPIPSVLLFLLVIGTIILGAGIAYLQWLEPAERARFTVLLRLPSRA